MPSMLGNNAIRDRDLYTRNRDIKLNQTLREVKKTLPQESSFRGNSSPCKMVSPKKRKLGL